MEDDTYYQQTKQQQDLPDMTHLISYHDNYDLQEIQHRTTAQSNTMLATSITLLDNDIKHRRSEISFMLKFTVGAIFFKTNSQKIISLPTIRSKPITAYNTENDIFHDSKIPIEDLEIPRLKATVSDENITGATHMENSGKRPVYKQSKIIKQPIEENLILMKLYTTKEKYVDAITNNIGIQLLSRHFGFIRSGTQGLFENASENKMNGTSHTAHSTKNYLYRMSLQFFPLLHFLHSLQLRSVGG